MRCQKLRSLLPAYCNRELGTSVTSAMERHFHECELCREDLAAHRLLAATIVSLPNSAPNKNHNENHHLTRSVSAGSLSLLEQHEVVDSEPMNTPEFRPLRVSADFNNRLMERIAQERFAETRSRARTKAFLPHNAPSFISRRLVPALVSVTAVAALAFVSLQQGMFGASGSVANGVATREADATASGALAFTPDDPALSAPALGAQLGLSDEYLTAMPINNPVYGGVAPNSTGGSSSPSAAQNASLVSARGSRPLSSSRRWRYARDYARSRRILNISNALCRRGVYFRIMQFGANGALIGPVGSVLPQCCPTNGQRPVGSPRIIVQPLPNAPVREQAPQSQMVRGSF